MMSSLNLTINNKIMATSPILMNPTVEDIHKTNIHSTITVWFSVLPTSQINAIIYFSPSFHNNKDITC